jgi:hypothetical protein
VIKKTRSIPTYIRNFVDDSTTHLRPFVAQGKYNNEFIKGRQNKKINNRTLTIEDKNVDPSIYTEKKIFNRILPIYLTRYGILTANMPVPGLKPISNSAKEVEDSRKVNSFLLSFISSTNFKDKYNLAVKHADVYGLEWFKTGIDWSDGAEIAQVEIETGSGEKGQMKVKEGKVFVLPVPLHEIFINNWHIESMDEVNELVHRRPFPLEYIKKRWGFDAQKEDIEEFNLPTYPKYSDIGYLASTDLEYAYIYEYYKKPDALYPNGRYIIVCNEKVLWDDVLPFVNDKENKRKIPFDFVALQTVPHHTVGVTVYQQIIPIQETYNAVKNRYLEYVNHIAIGQMYYWEGSLINKNSFSTKPGKLIGLKRNARQPVPVMKDKLSAEFINYLRTLEDDMLVAAGLSQITAYGMSRGNLRTDGVVDKLTESDENKLVNALDNLSEALIKVFKKVIYLEQDRERILHDQLKVAKVDNSAFQYSLQGVSADTLTIVNKEFLMQSDQVVDKKMQQAMGLGVYAPNTGMSYKAKIELLNSMRANYLQDTLDPMERATHDLVDEENLTMLYGTEVPQVEDFHNHGQHIAEHNLFRISPEIRKLKQENPKKYAALMDALAMHIEQHQKMAAEQSMNSPQSQAGLQEAKNALAQLDEGQG